MKKALYTLLIVTLSLSKSIVCFGQSNGVVDTVTTLMKDAILSNGLNIDKGASLIDGGIRSDSTVYYIDGVPVLKRIDTTFSNQLALEYLYKSDYYGMGIFGTIKHPGIELNYSFADKTFLKSKRPNRKHRMAIGHTEGIPIRREVLKVRRWELFTRYYYHRNFHHNIILTAGRSWQRKLKKRTLLYLTSRYWSCQNILRSPIFQS